MRPLELRLRNFRSYFGPEHTFDFRGRRLVGIVGPIGSGKSSILDAIAFALYGRTPAIARSTKALIHQRAEDGAVALRFEVEGQIWEAVRMLRRGGAGQHALYRLASDGSDPEITERVVQESDVNARVAQLLGLEFDAFTRSVFLAQGRFAEFLTAQPADRDRVLKGLFGHGIIDTMREAARGRSRQAEVEAEKLAIRVEQLSDLAAQLEAERVQLGAAVERRERLEEAETGVAELETEAADLASQSTQLAARMAELEDVAHRLPDPEVSADLLARGDEAGASRRALGETLHSAEERLQAARAGLAALESEVGKADISEADSLLAEERSLGDKVADVIARLEALERRIATGDAELADAEGALAEAVAAAATAIESLSAAEALLAEAQAEVHRAEHANAAMALRGALVPGERCPVCDQEVPEVPPVAGDDGVAEATARLADARSIRDDCDRQRLAAAEQEAARRTAVASMQQNLRELAEDRASEQARLPALEESLVAVEQRLTAILGTGDHVALLAARRERHEAATAAVAEATVAVDRARAGLDEGIAAQQRAEASLAELRVQLVDAAARLGADIEIGDSAASIGAALDAVRKRWTSERMEGRERAVAIEERAATVAAKREDLLTALDVEGDFAAALAAVGERCDLLAASVARTETRLVEGEDLRGALEDQVARGKTFGRLAADLTDARFVRYLLDEERTRLCLLGSDHFQRLSSGRYRFTEDGSFDIVDLTTAEAVRKADSLSGGETFLASLGLALSLAEMVTRSGGRIDAFFLDEGFGTLDPEHLDLAMEGIEALVGDASDRLVVVVSHVPEMRHRIDDLIVLDREATTGDTRVVAR